MITNIRHLCHILKTDIDTIEKIVDNIGTYYISWEKKKIVNGKTKTRPINSTKEELKQIQKRIYRFLLANVATPEYAYGGVPKRDNVLNAKQHQGNKYIFTTDLRAFFPSISHNQVFSLFLELGFSPTISRILTQLTTHNYQLPQGVPTSTLLANLVFKKTGDKVFNFSKSNHIKFTIFVDDLTLSSKVDFKDKIPTIIEILTNDGYKISHKKTEYKTKNPIITGIICQNNRLKLKNSDYKRIAQLEVQKKNNPDDAVTINKHKGLLQYRKKVDAVNI